MEPRRHCRFLATSTAFLPDSRGIVDAPPERGGEKFSEVAEPLQLNVRIDGHPPSSSRQRASPAFLFLRLRDLLPGNDSDGVFSGGF